MAKEQFPVKRRFSGETLFTAQIECAPDATISLKLGLAVKWAIKEGADLRSADLRSADLRSADLRLANLRSADLSSANLRSADLRLANLRSADLSSANLRSANLRSADLRLANLRSANLSSADLSSADLRSFKSDLWMTLTQNPHEVPGLIGALRAGKVNGSRYEGPCACLVGTIANVKHVSYETLDHDADNPAEVWFTMIGERDVPGKVGDDGKETSGGFAARMALAWSLEWCALLGVDPNGTAAKPKRASRRAAA